MDSEFFNLYVEKLTKYIHDLTNKNVILDTKATYSEQQLDELKHLFEAVKGERDSLAEERDRLLHERNELQVKLQNITTEFEAASKTLSRVTSERDKLAEELSALQAASEIETVTAKKAK